MLSNVCGALTLSILSVFVTSSLAFAGANGGGGGNVVRSTPKEVTDYFADDVYLHYRIDVEKVLHEINQGLKIDSELPILDARAKEILSKIVSKKDYSALEPTLFSIEKFNSVIKTDFKTDGPCLDKGRERDASMEDAGKNPGDPTKICISIPRLTRYTKEALNSHVPALVIHELAHAAGYGEDDAVYVQKYVLNKLISGCMVQVAMQEGHWFKIYIQNENTGKNLRVVRELYIRNSHPDVPNHSIVFNTTNATDQFKVSVSKTGGKLIFNGLNSDGTLSEQSVEFGPLKKNQNSFSYKLYKQLDTDVTKARLSVDGKEISSDVQVGVEESCINR